MQRYADDRTILRNGRIGRILTFGGLGVMAIGLVGSIVWPKAVNLVLGSAFVGIFGSQFGMLYYNKWGRRPRVDEIVDDTLKGLDGRFSVFHYKLGTNHALISPAGVFALIPRWEKGDVSYRDGKWSVFQDKGGMLRRSGQHVVRGVEPSAQAEVDALAYAIKKRLEMPEAFPVQALLVFLHPKASVKGKGSSMLAVHAKKLKETLRQLPKGQTLSEEEIRTLAAKLGL
jgi:hypothetical protein